ncbi:hypothetical protein GSI_05074 [Ganoderma sinense ZZ0214-1]|uniref:Uncharacterized protein n=1 Tax=Ganoderma sinense ZZ0214-1 TaxID=1077348 RepID=A0A2G8SGR5_9APHY|nr:hypothetical protein GSI_05074 [Ganoderma sinense ZZ0214-1]
MSSRIRRRSCNTRSRPAKFQPRAASHVEREFVEDRRDPFSPHQASRLTQITRHRSQRNAKCGGGAPRARGPTTAAMTTTTTTRPQCTDAKVTAAGRESDGEKLGGMARPGYPGIHRGSERAWMGGDR